MAAWRLAKSLDVLRSQINSQYPRRSKVSDGTIGDTKHSARVSDHNPNEKGVVCALDITHDPANGLNSEALAEALRKSKDPRIKYIISNRKIAASYATGGVGAWVWRRYTGANPHDKHCHISVLSDRADNISPWKLPTILDTAAPVVSVAPAPRVADIPKDDDTPRGNPDIWHIQRRLKVMNYSPGDDDGIWGGKTSGAIAAFINDRGSDLSVPTSYVQFVGIKDRLETELSQAEGEGFTRPIAVERALATPEELAPKLPEVKAAMTAERLGFWGSVTAGAASVTTGVAKASGEAVEWLTPIRYFIGDIPWQVWVGGAIVVSIALYYISKKSGDAKIAATQAYQEGVRN